MGKVVQIITDRLPDKSAIFATFGLILLVVHSHSLVQFFYRAPSFLKYLDVVNILATLAYFMAFAFLESILVLSGFLVLSLILPRSWYADVFDALNLPVFIVLTIAAYKFQGTILNSYPGITSILLYLAATLLIMLIVAIVFAKITILRKISKLIMERVSIMNYIYIPIGALSLLVVVYRLLV